jgi:hypothetical protein
MDGLDYVQAYFDNILIAIKNTYEDHLSKLDNVLQKLHAAKLKVNIEKKSRLLLCCLNIWITILQHTVFTHLLQRWKQYSRLSHVRP